MSEFDLIADLQQRITVRRPDVLAGIGDDCARVEVPAGFELAVTTDTLIEGVHFPAGTPPHAVGYKALAVNLSDLAAMGAEPAWVTLALSLPNEDRAWLDAFADGFLSLAEQYGVQLIGGDTTRGALSITVQAHGFIPKGRALIRGGARAGDYICVTGFLGEAGHQLQQTRRGEVPAGARNRLNYPEPRIIAGAALRDIATSAIDISDGLIADLGHILDSSGVGAGILLEELPLSPQMRSDPDPAAMLELALTAGDDYELCFTLAESGMESLEPLQQKLQLPIKPIGNIEKNPGLRIHRPGGSPLEIAGGGYDHFTESGDGR